jgi:hypothetical protein
LEVEAFRLQFLSKQAEAGTGDATESSEIDATPAEAQPVGVAAEPSGETVASDDIPF